MSIIKKDIIEHLLHLLENTKFPKCSSRTNVSKKTIEAFVLGDVNYRGQSFLNGKTRGPSRYNKKYPELLETLHNFISSYKPNFEYTTIQLNKNVKSLPHIDKNNIGPSYIIALGDYSGGELVIEGKKLILKISCINSMEPKDIGLNRLWNKIFYCIFYTYI